MRWSGRGASPCFLGGVRIDAAEAISWSLVDRLAPRDELREVAMDLSAAARESDRDHLLRLKAFCRESGQ